MKENSPIIVIGAGPAGLSAAYKLTQAGFSVEVYEAAPFVGGMARSFDLWEQRVDCGPHRFFSDDKLVNDLFFEVLEKEYHLVDRLTRIYYRKKFFHYPIKAFNALFNLGIGTSFLVLLSYLKIILSFKKEATNFEEFIEHRFGRKLFEIFFKNYSEKLWGIPCDKIDVDWAAQRIKNFSLFEAAKNILFGNKKEHKTLVEQFAYPDNGTGTLYEKMATFIRTNGGNIHLETPVKQIILNEENDVEVPIAIGIELFSGETIQSQHIISTMPMTTMVKGLKNVPSEVKSACEQLYFRNTILVYLEINAQDLFPDNWLYIHEPSVLHGRITNFSNWGDGMNKNAKTTILCLEYWAFDKDELWKESEENLIRLAKKEILETGLVASKELILKGKVIKLPKCYPVYETGYKQILKPIVKYLKSIKNLTPIGRYGSFKYNNQDHSILMGILTAKALENNRIPSLWEINSDSNYQEAEKVENTGF